MKKFTAILLTVIMVTSLFISCDNSMAPTVTDETVSVSFTETTSRSLTASLENFDQTKYWWAYAAQKADDTNLKSGETANYGTDGEVQVWIKGNPNTNSKGLGSVGGFSQGLWNFKLFAYKEKSSTDLTPVLAYQGEIKNVSLTKGSDNKVVVTVSPISTGTGKLKINDSISLKNFEENVTATNLTKEYTVTALNSTVAISPTNPSGDEWENLPVGAYKVTVEFKKDSITYGSGSVVATVYSNLTTEVSGFLKELVTNADFNSDINPDVMNKEASSDSIDYGTLTSTEPTAPTIVTLSEDTSKISASVPAAAVAEVIKNITESNTPNNNTSIELALRVDTIDATNTTLKLEIGMQATVTEKDAANEVVRQTSKAVSNLDDIVTVTVQLQAGLKNVQVYHNNSENPMHTLTNAEENAEGIYYNSTNGKLTIKTSSFSPFEITYDVPEFVAKIGNVKYTYLQGAIDAISSSTENTVIEILSNINLIDTVTISGKGPIEIELNGNVITGIGKRALLVQDGELTITGPGTITVSQGIEDSSSVIRVAGTNYREAKLTIGEDVTISSDYSYGITVFGPNKQTLIVNGSVKTKNVPAISGNGSSGFGKTDITINGNIETINENAIYHPQAGKLNINGSVKGLGGIEAKSGTTVSLGENARVEATATSVSHNPNSNGCSTSGYAIVAVENSAYKGNPKFNISGGTYIGPIAIISDNTVEDSKKASISITGGTFSTDPSRYVDFRYRANIIDNWWTISAISATEEDPILISNAGQFLKISSGSSTNKKYYKLVNDIDISNLSSSGYVLYYKTDIVLDGNYHKLIINDNNDNTFNCLFNYLYDSTIKNLEIELDYSIIYCSSNVIFSNVDVRGGFNVTGNEGAYIIYAYDGATFIDCNSYATLYGNGVSGNYNAVFVGYPYGNTFTFTNCTNEGSIICGKAAMFVANGSYDVLTLNISNCKNNGIVQSAFVTDNVKVYFPNYFRAITNDGKGGSLISVTVDGVEYKGNDKSVNALNGDKIEQLLTGENGSHINGPSDPTLALHLNADGTFSIIPASTSGVAKYEISIGMYATLIAGGSNREFIREIIEETGEQSYISTIKNLDFVDKKWVEKNTEAVQGTLNGYTIYTLNGTSYYYLLDPDNNTLNGNPRALTLFGVTAYDSDGNLVAAAGLTQN